MTEDQALVAKVKADIGEDTFNAVVAALADGYIGLADIAQIPQNELDNLHEMGRLKVSAKDYAEAARVLRMLVHLKPNQGEYWGTYGIALQNLGEYLKARTAYAVAIERVPRALEYRVYAAECELMMSNPKFALDVLEPVFHLKGDGDTVAIIKRAQRVRALVDRVQSGPNDKDAVRERRAARKSNN